MMRVSILYLLSFLFFVSSTLEAHELEYLSKKDKSSIVVGTNLRVKDPLYVANNASEGTHFVDQHDAVVNLIYGRENRSDIAGNTWFYEITYDLITRDIPVTVIGSGTVRIEHNNTEGIYESSKIHEDVSGNIEVRVTGINSTSGTAIPNDIRLEVKLNIERYDYLDEMVQPTLMMSSTTPDAKGQTEARWAYMSGAEYYEVEWIYWDAKNKTLPPTADDDLLFEEAIRVQTNNTHYKLDLVYPAGLVYFRVRPVGRFVRNGVDNSIEKRGEWSDKQVVAILFGFESQRNWTFSRAYAEDGKNKQAISYFDDGLKGRQSLTTLSSENTTIIAESVYDVENRPSLAIMPVPVNNENVTGSNLQFGGGHSSGLISTGGITYTRTDFDQHNQTTPTVLTGLPSNHIANQYYSSSNPFSTKIHKEYTPDAEGYPIAQVKYKNDGRGYVEQQSGVGKFYQLQTNRASKYYYVQPTTTELQALFGANVGEGKYYRKNYAVDANGQAAVSIVDQAGQTVVTALAGDVPLNVQDLDGSKKLRTETLMGSNTTSELNQTSTVVHNVFCDGNNIDYDFVYDLESAVNVVNDTPSFCLGCTYELEIQVRDANNAIIPCTLTTVNPTVTITGGILTSSYVSGQTPCTDTTYTPTNGLIEFRATLPSIGSYTVYKTLRATGPNADDILAQLQATGGVIDQQTFIDNYVAANFDSTECTDCSHAMRQGLCEDIIQTRYPDLDFADSIDLALYQLMLDTCMNDTVHCDALRLTYMYNQIIGGKDCEAILNEMIGQLSPGGCLYEAGFYSAAFADNWAIPDIIDLTTGNPISSDAIAVAMIEDTLLWQDGWADLLVTLHPEYCRYLACENDADLSASKLFDVELSGYGDWYQMGIGLGLTVSNPTTPAEKYTIVTTLIGADPFISNLAPVAGSVGAFNTNNPIDSILSTYCNDQCALQTPVFPVTCNCNGADILYFLEPTGPLGIHAPADEAAHLDMFRGIYLNTKQNLFYKDQCDLVIPQGIANFPSLSCQEITGEPLMQMANGNVIGFNSGITTVDELASLVANHVYGSDSTSTVSMCGQLCASRADGWIEDLCPGLAVAANDANAPAGVNALYNALRDGLINYCEYGCGSTLPVEVPVGSGNYLAANPLGELLTEDLGHILFTAQPLGIIALLDALQTSFPTMYCGTGTGSAALDSASVAQNTVYQPCISYYNLTAGLPIQNPKCDLLGDVFSQLDQNLFPVRFSTSTGTEPSFRSFNHFNTPLNTLIGVPAYASYINSSLLNGLNTISYFSPPGASGVTGVQLFNEYNYDNNGDLTDINRFIEFKGEGFDDSCSANLGLELIHPVTGEAINPLAIISLGTYDCTLNQVPVEYVTQSCVYANNSPNTSDAACSSPLITETVNAFVRVNIEPCMPSWEGGDTLMWKPIVDYTIINVGTAISQCDSMQIWELQQEAMSAYQTYLNDVVSEVLADASCVPVQERFSVTYESTEQHYTLYYYDEAGNLVQTLPPAAIYPLDMSPGNTNFVPFKNTLLPGVHPEHNYDLLTTYTYNTLGQVITQESPDGGLTTFFYDYAQRLRLSQNAKQAPTANDATTYGTGGDYAYTRFDEQGRVVEVGRLENYVVDINDLNSIDFPRDTQTLSEQTVTIYDNPMANGSLTQENLRSRVSGSYNEHNATRYSYDIHGNVKVIQHQIELFGAAEIEYDYDLITGNVNEVAFQKGTEDQFFHRYAYDADNRLTRVRTSKNSYLWDTEARYFYYAHGPLARVEIGQDKVQGMDYYYNLQGWMKGVNNTTEASDMGKDGDVVTSSPSVNKNKWFGKDEYAYNLGYHREDYKPIGGSILGVMEHSGTSIFDNELKPASATGSPTTGLFNGNIAFMITHIPELEDQVNNKQATNAMVYQYDALHRIKQAKSFHLNKSNSQWTRDANTEWYDTKYSYDKNGNIKTLERYNKGTLIDDLVYRYKVVTPGGSNPNQNLTGRNFNQLNYVEDNVTAVTVGDFEDQSIPNYQYDVVGNLIEDLSQEIDQTDGGSIQWNLMNKIDQVTYSTTSGKKPLEFTYDVGGSRLTKTSTVNRDRVTTVYIRDAGGNIMATYEMVDEERLNLGEDPETFPFGAEIYSKTLKEMVLYGASRLGVRKFDDNWDSYIKIEEAPSEMLSILPILTGTEYVDISARGDKLYESSNHLGNVLVTFSDKKIGKVNNLLLTSAEYYEANVTTASDYYPFGWQIPNRKLNPNNYQFGFNGQETDTEWNGGQSVNFLFRVHDPRLGRFLSVDPLAPSYPWYTPYQFAGNMPIWARDLEGAEPDKKGSKEGEGTSDGSGKNIPMSKGGKCGGLDKPITESAKESKTSKKPAMGTEATNQQGQKSVYLESEDRNGNKEGLWYPKPSDNELDKLESDIYKGIKRARTDGYVVAPNNLERFMKGVGGTKPEDVQWLQQQRMIKKAMDINYDRFFTEKHSSGKDESIEFLASQLKDGGTVTKPTDYWVYQIVIAPWEIPMNDKLFWAYGNSALKTESSFEITRNGNYITVTGVMTHTFIDDYNWHIGKVVKIPGVGTVKDENMLLMQVYKGAKPFNVRTEWTEEVNQTFEFTP